MKKTQKHQKNTSIEAHTATKSVWLMVLFIFFSLFLVGTVAAADWDNKLSYSNEDLKVTISNSFLGLFPTTEIGTAELKSHSFVDEVVRYGAGDQVTMWYDFWDWKEIYLNGLGEVYFTDMRTGQEIDRDYSFVYWGEKTRDIYDCDYTYSTNGTKICNSVVVGKETYKTWLPYNSKDIPKGNIRIGLMTYVEIDDKVDGVWTIAGKKISRHAEWTESLNVGLVAYYKFDGTSGVVVDELGVNNGTNYGATRGVAGKIGNAFDFENSEQDWVSLGVNTDIVGANPSAWSYAFWVKTEDAALRKIVASTYGAGSVYAFFVEIDIGENIDAFVKSVDGAFGQNNIGDVNRGAWSLIAVSAEKNGRILVSLNDSIIINESVASSNNFFTGEQIKIGGDSNLSLWFDGLIDEIPIWNRALTADEMTVQLWNNSYGITHELYIPEISTSLISPTNNTQTNDDPLTFMAQVTPNTYNLTNATIYIWYDNGTLYKSQHNTTISGNESLNVTFDVSSWVIGNYLWNVYGCQGNCNDTNSSFADENFTLQWIPFEVDAESYNGYTYETKNETFYLNITTDETVSNIGSFLVYNSGFYAADHSCSGGLCEIERKIDIPLLNNQALDSENKTFYWQITLFGTFGTFTTNTTTYQQNVTNIKFTTSSSGNTKATIFITYNETTLTTILTDFKATFSYYLGGGTIQEKYNYSSSGSHTNNFYINHNLTFITTSQIEIKNGTFEREYYLSKEPYTNSTTTQPLYIPDPQTSNIIVEVKDQGLIPKPNILVNISRFYNELNQYKMVESKLTDEYGEIVAKLVQTDVKYRFSFYDLDKNLLKTSDMITIACRTSICILPFVIEAEDDYFERFETYTLFSYELSFDNTTNIFLLSWDDQRNENSIMRFEVTRFKLNGSTILCNSTSTTKVSALTCSVGSESASYKAQVFRTIFGSNERRIALLNVKVGDGASTYGVEGLLWAFILLFTCFGIGAFNPTAGAVLYGAGFIILGVIGIISVPVTVFFANTAIVAIFIWAVNT